MNLINYHLNFFKHCNDKNHKVTLEEQRLKQIIKKNYYKSLFIGNLIALYSNYLRKNKTFPKIFISKLSNKIF